MQTFTVIATDTQTILGTIEAPNHWEAFGPAVDLANANGVAYWYFNDANGRMMGGTFKDIA